MTDLHTLAIDFPVACPEGVDPVLFRAQILQSMAARYKSAVPDLDMEDAMAAAIATWETEWDDDPNLRTIETAIEEVDSDLQYWGDD